MNNTTEVNQVSHTKTVVADTLSAVISARRTTKRFVDPARRHDLSAPLAEAEKQTLNRILSVAGQAPFHKPAARIHCEGPLGSPVPWRFHVLERPACIKFVDWLEQQAASGEAPWPRAWTSKIPALLSAAGAVVLVTWLPYPLSATTTPDAENKDSHEFSHMNIEAVAASGAAVQNLMLMAEAEGWDSYWSSGGALRESETFDHLGIATVERLLGAIMLTPRDHDFDKTAPGGLFDRRGELADWTRRIEL